MIMSIFLFIAIMLFNFGNTVKLLIYKLLKGVLHLWTLFLKIQWIWLEMFQGTQKLQF